MARLVQLLAVVLVIGSGCALYALKHDTRRIEQRVQRQERDAERLQSDLAVLKSERAYLARPDRIERLARRQGLEPVREHQYLRIGQAFEDGIARLIDETRDDDATEPTTAAPGTDPVNDRNGGR
ncbi:MAG: cell division protein FtsL [Hyphomicrobiaceae bacterium]